MDLVMDDSDTSSDTVAFWLAFEDFTGEIIPDYLKNLISAAGYARFSALKSIDNRLINSLETFAKEQMPLFCENTSKIFHVYYKNPEKFKIVPGHVELLNEAATKLPNDSKVFVKSYRKHYLRNSQQSKKPTVERFEPTTSSSTSLTRSTETKQLGCSNKIEASSQSDSVSSEPDPESTAIVAKVLHWTNTRQIKFKHDLEVISVGSRQRKIKCEFCSKLVALSSRANKNGSCCWIISNFTHHIAEHLKPKPMSTINDFFSHTSKTVLPPKLPQYEKLLETPDIQDKDHVVHTDVHSENLCKNPESAESANTYNTEDLIMYDPISDEERDRT